MTIIETFMEQQPLKKNNTRPWKERKHKCLIRLKQPFAATNKFRNNKKYINAIISYRVIDYKIQDLWRIPSEFACIKCFMCYFLFLKRFTFLRYKILKVGLHFN